MKWMRSCVGLMRSQQHCRRDNSYPDAIVRVCGRVYGAKSFAGLSDMKMRHLSQLIKTDERSSSRCA